VSPRQYTVYILSSATRVLYVGVTGDLRSRLSQHRTGTGSRFTARYRVHQLVHVETFQGIADALCREKQLKGWSRSKKLALIAAANPEWRDLSGDLR